MSLTGLFAHTLEVRRNNPTGTDAYGHPAGNIDTVVGQYEARFQHHNSWEDREGRLVQVQNWRCYTPPSVDVTEDDMAYWVEEGKLFEILVVEPVANATTTHHKYMMLQEIF
jgi:hypothetical protein